MRDRARHRLTMAFGAAICGMLLLSACGNLPRPFGREDDVDASGVRPEMFFEAVQVSPVAGTTKPMGTLLAQAVSERLQSRYEIPSALDGLSKGRFHLTGSVVEAGGGVVAIDWKLRDRAAGVTTSVRQPVSATKLEWDYGSPRILTAVGEETSGHVAKLVLGDRINPPSQTHAGANRSVYLPAVTGAPGDGNAALRRAMMVALSGVGMSVLDVEADAAFQVAGTVTVKPPDGGQQSIAIVWLVKDRDGKVLGRASQANAVPAGSLDGRWGQTAAFVAAAAVPGVAGVIDEAAPQRPRVPDLGAGPYKGPARREIQRQPGRALPPPQ